MSSRYNLMRDSVVKGSDGTYYKDPLTLSEKEIVIDNDPMEYTLTKSDIERFDLLISRTYQNYNIYKDVVLQYNNISYMWDFDSEDILLIPERDDLSRFIRNNTEG